MIYHIPILWYFSLTWSGREDSGPTTQSKRQPVMRKNPFDADPTVDVLSTMRDDDKTCCKAAHKNSCT